MLIPMKEIKSKSYPLYKGFFIDVITKNKTYEAWIYHKDYGIKDLMFGVPKNQQSYEKFLDIVEANTDEYINSYTNEYMLF